MHNKDNNDKDWMDDNCLFIAIQMLEKQKEIQDRSLEPNVCHSMPLPVDPISRGNEEEEEDKDLIGRHRSDDCKNRYENLLLPLRRHGEICHVFQFNISTEKTVLGAFFFQSRFGTTTLNYFPVMKSLCLLSFDGPPRSVLIDICVLAHRTRRNGRIESRFYYHVRV